MTAKEQIEQITNMLNEMSKVAVETGMFVTGHEGDRRAMDGAAAVVASGHRCILKLIEQIKDEVENDTQASEHAPR